MSKVHALPANRLSTYLDPHRIAWQSSEDIPRNGSRRIQQPRALEALELALHINASGYNIFLSGSTHLGRTYMLQSFLAPKIKKCPTPPDLLYVNNFEDPDRPTLLAVPAGQGKKLFKALARAIKDIRKELPNRLERKSYLKKRGSIHDIFEGERSHVLKAMNTIASDEGFSLEMDDMGSLTLYPMIDAKRLTEEEFEKLDSKVRQTFKQRGEALLLSMGDLMQKLTKLEEKLRSDEQALDKEVIEAALSAILDPVLDRTERASPNNSPLKAYFVAMRQDMIKNPEAFLPKKPVHTSTASMAESSMPIELDPFRYAINLFVDNSELKGAPLIIEHHPTHAKLLGCIEREAEMGALITDFTLIKAGAIHKANGGFLLVHLEDLLQYPQAFEGFMRALRASSARFEDAESDSVIRTKGIEPEPLTLNLKVILVGTEDLYDSLITHDDRFLKLFKIKAHMHTLTERTASSIRSWLSHLPAIIDEGKLLPFTREALAGLVDFSSRMAEDQRKLSLKYPLIRDIMIEASAMASMEKAKEVTAKHLHTSLQARMYRQNLVEEVYLEEYDRELIKVQTSGEAIGRINGLSVSWYGDFEFGLPHQITCTVGVGHGGIIDLEREAELGGPIHTKAMLILKSYLVDQFARNKPIVLTGSLCFEQNYAGVEGDSASGAELTALLSAIAETPLSNSFAFTGAVSQKGHIMAVGGVTRKVEGFFKLCEHRGLTGKQGVILPYDNIDHLLLAPNICEAVKKGLFAIYPVRHITEALEILTGIPAGRPLKKGGFTKDSLFDRVDKRLELLGHLAENAFSKRPKVQTTKKSKK